MVAITKAHLINHVHNAVGLHKAEARQLVELFFSEIMEVLQQGEELKLSGFGVFGVRSKKERPGRNPKTGETVAVSARRVVTFKAGEKLKAKVSLHAVQKNR